MMNFLFLERNQPFYVVLSLLMLALVSFKVSSCSMANASDKILLPLTIVDSIQQNMVDTALTDNVAKEKTLKNQFMVCQQIKLYYKHLSQSYYQYYYSFTLCAIIFSILLTIAVFLVANKGWQNSPGVYRSFLLATVGLSSLFYFLPNVLNNKANLENNIAKVKIYQNLQVGILQFAAIIDSRNESQIDSAITDNYSQMAKNLDFLTAIDVSKLDENPEDKLNLLPGKSHIKPAKK